MRLSLVLSLAIATWAAPVAAQEDPVTSLQAWAEALFVQFGNQDYDGIRATSDDVLVFDVDGELRPFAVRGPAWNARLDDLVASIQSVGASVAYDVTSIQCSAQETLGFCAVEYVSTATGGPTPVTLRWRVTLVARWADGAWTLAHLHGSPAE